MNKKINKNLIYKYHLLIYKTMKYLSSKDKVFEFFNPVLDGNFMSPPSNPPQQRCQNEMPEVPLWLNSDVEENDVTVMQGDPSSIGTFFLNGVPLSSWSAQRGGSLVGYNQKQTYQNWYYVQALTKHLFPDGINAYINKTNTTELKITNVTIVKMIPLNIGIGFNIHVKFNINDNDTEIWGKFEKVGIDIKPKFICQEIENFSIEHKIKTIGKLWNIITEWFKIKPGIYKCNMKNVLVFTELGQLKNIEQNNIIEVIFSDDEKIRIKLDNKKYIIKKPTYYWFNWYFEKI